MDVDGATSQLNRAQRKYLKRKQKQQEKKALKRNVNHEEESAHDSNKNALNGPITSNSKVGGSSTNGVEIEYVSVNPVETLDESDPNYEEFSDIFRRFNLISQGLNPVVEAKREAEKALQENQAAENGNTAASNDTNEARESESKEAEVPKKLSRRQRRLARRIDIADLKKAVLRPDLVEIHDTTAQDPFLLVHLKSYRNSVPIPRHWGQKRKYLQGKRGIEKKPFQLPDFIRNTGITDLRQAALDRAEQQKLKAKQRERLRPKMGQLSVDYRILHDAFFRYQTKPNLTSHGELYYEGREFEPKTKDFVAGHLSDNLKRALGMPEGAPPPWIVSMQQQGPPPSYPYLRIPGVNAPIPQGAQYGFHAGGWGSAPVDINTGRPLWGWADANRQDSLATPDDFDKNFVWGAKQYAEDYADEAEFEDQMNAENQEGGEVDEDRMNITERGLEEENIELRKFTGEASVSMEGVVGIQQQKELYSVLSQEQTSVGSSFMGSSYTYAIPPKKFIDNISSSGQKIGQLEISLDPSDLELSEDELRAKYAKLFREHERQQLQHQGSSALTDADRVEMIQRSTRSEKKEKPKSEKKEYIKF